MKQSSLIVITIISFAVLALSSSTCTKEDNGKRKNPFENTDQAEALKVSYTSNADSVFLKFDIPLSVTDFDAIKINDANGKNNIIVSRGKSDCILTHMPYNSPTKVTLAVMNGKDIVLSTDTYVTIDGLDYSIQKKIMPDRGSVTGGDGMYSIALPGDRTIFLMGDSYTGNVNDGHRSTSDHMYRNTYSVYDLKTEKSFAIVGENNHSAAVPVDSPNEKEWYWPGHGFVDDNTLYIFQSLMYQGSDGMWGFMYKNTHILEYTLPDIKLIRDSKCPVSTADNVHYGAAALNDGDYMYIYAQVDLDNSIDPKTAVYAARATATSIRENWEFWNGSTWVTSSDQAVALEGLSSVAISSQFNIFKHDGKYILLTQRKNWNSGEVITFTSDSPVGQWGHKKTVYKAPEGFVKPSWFSYNAMAHPEFEKEGMFLVSYCVNTQNFQDQFTDVYSYRPRFFWVEYETVLN